MRMPTRNPTLRVATALAWVAACRPGPAPAPPELAGGSEASAPSRNAEAAETTALDQAPRDPDEAPFLPPPYGQLGRWPQPSIGALSRDFRAQRRFQITLLPAFAAIRLPFDHRPLPIRGGGAALELDVRLVDWLWLRALASYTVHPVRARGEVDVEAEKVTILANAGQISVTHAGLGLVYALDLGRFLPLIDAGFGFVHVLSPAAAQDGQLGGKCRSDGSCEIGLHCAVPQSTCQPTLMPQIHAGLGLDYLLASHWAVGIQVRYHAQLREPGTFPVYLTASLRAAFRF